MQNNRSLLFDYLDVKVKPKRVKNISLAEKYPESSFVFLYHDGEAARIDCGDIFEPTLKGEETLLQCLTGATNPTEEDGDENSFSQNLLVQDDLLALRKLDSNIVRAWVLTW